MRGALNLDAVLAVADIVNQVDESLSIEDAQSSITTSAQATEAVLPVPDLMVLEPSTSSGRTGQSRNFSRSPSETRESVFLRRRAQAPDEVEIEARTAFLADMSPTYRRDYLEAEHEVLSRHNRTCHLCGNQPIDGQIRCRGYKCEKLVKFCCAELDNRTVKNIDVFFCFDCQRKYKVRTLHLTDPESFDEGVELIPHDDLPSDDSETEEEREYEVESIKAHFIRARGERMFLAKWVGYKRPTWMLEANLAGCIALVNKYCISSRIPRSRIAPADTRNGAVGDSGHNPENWVETEKILASVKRFATKPSYNTGIKVEEFTTLRNKTQDTIYILSLYNHTYVVVHLPSCNKCFVIDGTNTFLESDAHKITINNLLGQEATGIRFNHQKKIDYCASSAVMITMECMRLYKTMKWTDAITAPRWMMKETIKIYHKFPSKAVDSSKASTFAIPTLECKICGKRFKTHKRSALSLHMRKSH